MATVGQKGGKSPGAHLRPPKKHPFMIRTSKSYIIDSSSPYAPTIANETSGSAKKRIYSDGNVKSIGVVEYDPKIRRPAFDRKAPKLAAALSKPLKSSSDEAVGSPPKIHGRHFHPAGPSMNGLFGEAPPPVPDAEGSAPESPIARRSRSDDQKLLHRLKIAKIDTSQPRVMHVINELNPNIDPLTFVNTLRAPPVVDFPAESERVQEGFSADKWVGSVLTAMRHFEHRRADGRIANAIKTSAVAGAGQDTGGSGAQRKAALKAEIVAERRKFVENKIILDLLRRLRQHVTVTKHHQLELQEELSNWEQLTEAAQTRFEAVKAENATSHQFADKDIVGYEKKRKRMQVQLEKACEDNTRLSNAKDKLEFEVVGLLKEKESLAAQLQLLESTLGQDRIRDLRERLTKIIRDSDEDVETRILPQTGLEKETSQLVAKRNALHAKIRAKKTDLESVTGTNNELHLKNVQAEALVKRVEEQVGSLSSLVDRLDTRSSSRQAVGEGPQSAAVARKSDTVNADVTPVQDAQSPDLSGSASYARLVPSLQRILRQGSASRIGASPSGGTGDGKSRGPAMKEPPRHHPPPRPAAPDTQEKTPEGKVSPQRVPVSDKKETKEEKMKRNASASETPSPSNGPASPTSGAKRPARLAIPRTPATAASRLQRPAMLFSPHVSPFIAPPEARLTTVARLLTTDQDTSEHIKGKQRVAQQLGVESKLKEEAASKPRDDTKDEEQVKEKVEESKDEPEAAVKDTVPAVEAEKEPEYEERAAAVPRTYRNPEQQRQPPVVDIGKLSSDTTSRVFLSSAIGVGAVLAGYFLLRR